MLLFLYHLSLFLIDFLTFLWKAILADVCTLVSIVFPPEKKSVADDTVLITGGGQGLGRELALLFSKLGAKIVLWDINEAAVEQTASEIKKLGGNAYAYACDVSSRDEIMKVAQKIQNEVGDITMLINNAGILPCMPFLELNHQQIQKCMEINTLAHFWTMQAFLPKMIELGKGHIVCIASMAGKDGYPNQVAYCASKFAVTGMMSALSSELHYYNHDFIKTTTVHPVILNTSLAQRPRVKYSFLLPIVEVEFAAKTVVDGVLRNEKSVYIPRSVAYSFKIILLLPEKVKELFYDFLGYGLDPHDK